MAASSNAGTLRWLRPTSWRETRDWVNVMNYDFTALDSYAGITRRFTPPARARQEAARSS